MLSIFPINIQVVLTNCQHYLYIGVTEKVERIDNMLEKSKEIGPILRELMQKQSLSMRKLSQLTGIDLAIISKVINGKRKATPEHLQRFAEKLNVPLSALYEAAGYPVVQKHSDLNDSVAQIQSILKSSNLVDREFCLEDLNQELEKYQNLSLTKEGAEAVHIQFDEKIEKVGSIGPFIHNLKDMYERFIWKKGTKMELAMIGGALLYFISAVDCLPDYLFPVGYLDDAVVIHWVMNTLQLKNYQ